MQEKINKKNDAIKCRLLQFAEHQGIPKMDFYKKISVPQSNFGGESLKSSLSSAKIAEILFMFPELSADWLLLEKGEMLRKNNPKNTALATAMQPMPCSGGTDDGTSAALLKIMASQQDTILTLSQTIARLTK